MSRGAQLDLFAPPAPAALDFSVEAALAARLPPHLRLGTSSWSFPGWAGLVYAGRPTEKELADVGLAEYARHPLMTTVGIDRSYYAPIDGETWRRYDAQLPPGFPCVIKALSEITAAVHPKTREANPSFLDAARCTEVVCRPLLENFAEHVGALVFELPPVRRSELMAPRDFALRLGAFLDALPSGLPYAVELRNRELFTPRYLDVLRERGVGHVLNYWERMPDVGAQLDVPGVLTAEAVVTRLLIPPGQRYAERKAALAPFDRIVEPQEKMRADVERLVQACAELGRVLLVIVNNKAEGSSPLTVRALAERIARRDEP